MLLSVATVIRLADLTSLFEVGASEFFRIFAFAIPQLVFYALPISFFAAVCLSLSKLSFDKETIVFFSLGISPSKLAKIYLPLATLFFAMLIFLGLILNPLAGVSSRNFIELKKSSAKLNLKPNEFGQKFGDWLIFVTKKNGANSFEGVVLFKNGVNGKSKADSLLDGDTFIYAKKGVFGSSANEISLTLYDGEANVINRAAAEPDYKKMGFGTLKINEEIGAADLRASYLLSYWLQSFEDNKRAKDFTDTVLVALFPLVSLFSALRIGIANPRYEKNRAGLYALGSVAFYYLLILLLSPLLLLWAIALLPSAWLAGSYLLFKKTILSRY